MYVVITCSNYTIIIIIIIFTCGFIIIIPRSIIMSTHPSDIIYCGVMWWLALHRAATYCLNGLNWPESHLTGFKYILRKFCYTSLYCIIIWTCISWDLFSFFLWHELHAIEQIGSLPPTHGYNGLIQYPKFRVAALALYVVLHVVTIFWFEIGFWILRFLIYKIWSLLWE